MMTGTSPLEHRILDFVQFDPASGVKEPITSSERRVPAVWNMASARTERRPCSACGRPIRPSRSTAWWCRIACSRFSTRNRRRRRASCFRRSRSRGRATRWRARSAAVDFDALRAYLPWLTRAEYDKVADSDDPYAQPVSALRRMLIETTVYGDLSLQWIREQHPDLASSICRAPTPSATCSRRSRRRRRPASRRRTTTRYSAVPEKFFRALDERIAQYRDAAAAAGGVLMLASDHGFLWGEGRPTRLSSVATASAAKWHAPYGMYLIWGDGVRRKAGPRGGRRRAAGGGDAARARRLPPGRDVNGDPLDGAPAVQAPRADYAASYRPRGARSRAGTGNGRRSRCGGQPAIARLHRRERERHRAAGQPRLDANRRFVQQRRRDPQGARQAAAGDRGVREGADRRSEPRVGASGI